MAYITEAQKYENHDFDVRTIQHVREAIATAREGISECSTPTMSMVCQHIDWLAIVPDDNQALDFLTQTVSTLTLVEILGLDEATDNDADSPGASFDHWLETATDGSLMRAWGNEWPIHGPEGKAIRHELARRREQRNDVPFVVKTNFEPTSRGRPS